jgi:hypothetical protein
MTEQTIQVRPEWEELETRIKILLGNPLTVDAACSEFSPQFVRLMIAAMMVSFHKYGALADAYPHRVKALPSLAKRLEMYEETGNTEYLVDVANFAMIEFMRPAHPKAFYEPTDADGSPGRVIHASDYANAMGTSQLSNRDLSTLDEELPASPPSDTERGERA